MRSSPNEKPNFYLEIKRFGCSSEMNVTKFYTNLPKKKSLP